MRRSVGLAAILVALAPAIRADDATTLIQAVRYSDKDAILALIRERQIDVNQAQPDGATALSWAALRGDVAIADLLIRAGADVNHANEYTETPLSIACTSQNLPMIERLLEAHANPNARRRTGETPLMSAARAGNLPIVKELIEHAADVNLSEAWHGQTALMWAAAEGRPEVVRFLIARGANVVAATKTVQVPYPIYEADGRFSTGQYTDAKGGYTALFFAVQKGDLESVKQLLDAGDNVNRAAADGTTPLLLALFLHGNPLRQYPHTMEFVANPELAHLLLSRGADPKIHDADGYTPLHAAIFIGMGTDVPGLGRPRPPVSAARKKISLELVQDLLNKGADPNARIKRNIPVSAGADTRSPPNYVGASGLMLAAMSGDVAIMQALAEHQADPSIAKEDGTTVLIAAAEENNVDAVKLMLKVGANLQAFSNTGWTAMHAAARAGANDSIRFLATQGGRFDVRDKEGNTPLMVAQSGKARANKTAELIQSLTGMPPETQTAGAASAAEASDTSAGKR